MSKTLLAEIRNIAVCVFLLGIIQVLVVALTGFFDLSAVSGTLLGCAVAVFNFAFMGIILEKSISHQKNAGGFMSIGYIARLAIIGIAVVWAMRADYLNYVCAIIPLIFPQISIFIFNRIKRKESG